MFPPMRDVNEIPITSRLARNMEHPSWQAKMDDAQSRLNKAMASIMTVCGESNDNRMESAQLLGGGPLNDLLGRFGMHLPTADDLRRGRKRINEDSARGRQEMLLTERYITLAFDKWSANGQHISTIHANIPHLNKSCMVSGNVSEEKNVDKSGYYIQKDYDFNVNHIIEDQIASLDSKPVIGIASESSPECSFVKRILWSTEQYRYLLFMSDPVQAIHHLARDAMSALGLDDRFQYDVWEIVDLSFGDGFAIDSVSRIKIRNSEKAPKQQPRSRTSWRFVDFIADARTLYNSWDLVSTTLMKYEPELLEVQKLCGESSDFIVKLQLFGQGFEPVLDTLQQVERNDLRLDEVWFLFRELAAKLYGSIAAQRYPNNDPFVDDDALKRLMLVLAERINIYDSETCITNSPLFEAIDKEWETPLSWLTALLNPNTDLAVFENLTQDPKYSNMEESVSTTTSINFEKRQENIPELAFSMMRACVKCFDRLHKRDVDDETIPPRTSIAYKEFVKDSLQYLAGTGDFVRGESVDPEAYWEHKFQTTHSILSCVALRFFKARPSCLPCDSVYLWIGEKKQLRDEVLQEKFDLYATQQYWDISGKGKRRSADRDRTETSEGEDSDEDYEEDEEDENEDNEDEDKDEDEEEPGKVLKSSDFSDKSYRDAIDNPGPPRLPRLKGKPCNESLFSAELNPGPLSRTPADLKTHAASIFQSINLELLLGPKIEQGQEATAIFSHNVVDGRKRLRLNR